MDGFEIVRIRNKNILKNSQNMCNNILIILKKGYDKKMNRIKLLRLYKNKYIKQVNK